MFSSFSACCRHSQPIQTSVLLYTYRWLTAQWFRFTFTVTPRHLNAFIEAKLDPVYGSFPYECPALLAAPTHFHLLHSHLAAALSLYTYLRRPMESFNYSVMPRRIHRLRDMTACRAPLGNNATYGKWRIVPAYYIRYSTFNGVYPSFYYTCLFSQRTYTIWIFPFDAPLFYVVYINHCLFVVGLCHYVSIGAAALVMPL